MLAKRHVGFVLSIQVIPAQLGVHKNLFYFYTFGPFIMAHTHTNCNKNKICGRGIFRKMFDRSVLFHHSAKKDSGDTFKCLQSSAHLRQQESTIFWSFSQSCYTLLQAVALCLWRRERTTHTAAGSNERLLHGTVCKLQSVVQGCSRSLYAWQWNEGGDLRICA